MTCRGIAALTVFLCWAIASAASEALPEDQRALFLKFASDVSEGDQRVMEIARRIVTEPPTTIEGIGFYGMTDAPPAERALRGIVSLLDAQGHLVSLQDKYAFDLATLLVQKGVLHNQPPDPALDVLGFFKGVDPDTGPTPAQWAKFRDWFPRHVQAMEGAVSATGHELLSLRLPLGDTLYFWAPPSRVAGLWRDRALYIGVNTIEAGRSPFVSMSVTSPDWASYWDFMTYALDIPPGYSDTPDGVN